MKSTVACPPATRTRSQEAPSGKNPRSPSSISADVGPRSCARAAAPSRVSDPLIAVADGGPGGGVGGARRPDGGGVANQQHGGIRGAGSGGGRPQGESTTSGRMIERRSWMTLSRSRLRGRANPAPRCSAGVPRGRQGCYPFAVGGNHSRRHVPCRRTRGRRIVSRCRRRLRVRGRSRRMRAGRRRTRRLPVSRRCRWP